MAMSRQVCEGRNACIQELLDNPEQVFKSTVEVLLKLANNILENPNDSKYRSVRVGSSTFTEKLLPVPGALECLFAMGFEEDGERFTFPENKDTSNMKLIRDELLAEKENVSLPRLTNSRTLKPVNLDDIFTIQSAGQSADQNATSFVLDLDEKPYPSNLKALESRFLAKLQDSLRLVELHEDVIAQRKARACIPVEKLKEKAKEKLKNLENLKVSLDFNDMLLLELMKWFKEDFFQWMDKPKCNLCNSLTINKGMTVPNPEELQWNASRVELFVCMNCQKEFRFPRYNHPVKLLESRQGRCGEWANCFTLCCRALGLEVRYVVDWTDHVWNEIYSSSQSRWIHCDPCENACDKPLLYESGWKKKLSYVIAFSKDEIVDVTWRYSADHDGILKRRLECRESWLLTTIQKLNQNLQQSLPLPQKEMLLQRQITELAEFLTPPCSAEELGGRTSGSLEWRLVRGETTLNQVDKSKPYVFTLNKQEIKSRKFHLRYFTVSDKYVRLCSNDELKGWQHGTFEYSNMALKTEHDWKMVYLSRTEGSAKSSISWNFDFRKCGLVINTVELLCQRTVFENGIISCKLCSEDRCWTIPEDGTQSYSTEELRGMQTMKLHVDLYQGQGDCAWQHTQLFRLPLNSEQKYGFEIIVTFIPENLK